MTWFGSLGCCVLMIISMVACTRIDFGEENVSDVFSFGILFLTQVYDVNGDSELRHRSMDDHGQVEHMVNYELCMIHDLYDYMCLILY